MIELSGRTLYLILMAHRSRMNGFDEGFGVVISAT